MPNQQGGRWRRQNGKLTQVDEPSKEQRYGAHAEHPSRAEAPSASPAKAPSGGKATAKAKDDKDDATT